MTTSASWSDVPSRLDMQSQAQGTICSPPKIYLTCRSSASKRTQQTVQGPPTSLSRAASVRSLVRSPSPAARHQSP